MFNSLILQGHLTKDFINKNGNAYGGIAIDNYKGDVMYVDLVAFGKNAEFCLNYLRKGANVIVEGALCISKYQEKTYVSCALTKITSVGSNKVNAEEETQTKEETPKADVDVSADDLPF